MAEDWPKVKARHTRRVSPWMAIIEREVEFAPGAECDLPCGQPAGLHRHRRSVTGSPPSYRPAIPPGVGELYLGIACRAHRSRRGCGRVLPPRTRSAIQPNLASEGVRSVPKAPSEDRSSYLPLGRRPSTIFGVIGLPRVVSGSMGGRRE